MSPTVRGSKRASIALLCDFDDTVAEQNVAEMLLARFSDETWRSLREQFRARNLTLREYQERAFSRVRADRETLKALVREKATLRPRFKELWYYCRENGIPLAIVTHGLDFYVEALLEREGLHDLPYYAVKALFTPSGIDYAYLYTKEGCWEWGNCKCAILERYRERGYAIAYVGDGRSDFCPASRADFVFARGPLLVYCRENGIKAREFRDFREILGAVRELTGTLKRG